MSPSCLLACYATLLLLGCFQNSLAADKPSLMLDVRTDLPFKDIRKIMQEFAYEPVRDATITDLHYITLHYLNTS